MYGKQTECAIAAMSRLAEVYDGGRTRLAAGDIATDRHLPGPFVAKTLSALAQAGLVVAARGPGGGFALARPPKDITLHQVFVVFEREDDSDRCPFGGGRCGSGEPCALHDKLVAVQEATHALLHGTTFDVFRVAYQEQGLRPAPGPSSKKRQSWRAPNQQAASRIGGSRIL